MKHSVKTSAKYKICRTVGLEIILRHLVNVLNCIERCAGLIIHFEDKK